MRRLDFARNKDWDRIPEMVPDEAGDYVEHEEAAAVIRQLVKERDDAREWAIEMAAYVPDYFMVKHKYNEIIEEYKSALSDWKDE